MTTIDPKNSDQAWFWSLTINPEEVLRNIDKIDRLIKNVFYIGTDDDETDNLADDLMTLVYSPGYGD
jgi:hypothetical protein